MSTKPRLPLVGNPVIAANIKRALKDADMLPVELARRLQITPQAVSQWVKAQTTPPVRRLHQIATELNIDAEKLFHAPVQAKATLPSPVFEEDDNPYRNAAKALTDILDPDEMPEDIQQACLSMIVYCRKMAMRYSRNRS